ncbi:MAG: acyl-CoA thioesterase [Acidobacteria bacterium]|nr:acyl-CoA thioesterase [Acidobacteriota bacterium]
MGKPSPSVAGFEDGWYVVPHEVTWQDLDAMGHVNNAVYFAYFEWARTKYWMEMVGATEPSSLTFIVARAECDFRRELNMMELVHIRVRISEMRSSSLDFVYEVVKAASGEIAATGKVVVVLFSWQERRKIAISDELRARVGAFQGEAR